MAEGLRDLLVNIEILQDEIWHDGASLWTSSANKISQF